MNKDNPLFRMMQKHVKPVSPPAGQGAPQATPSPLTKALTTIMTPGFGEKNISDSPKQGLTSVSTSASMGAGMSEKASTEVKVPTNMQLSPMAQRLMQTTQANVQAVAVADGSTPEYKPLVADGGIHELAAMNTDSLEPQMHVEKGINVKAEALTKASVLDSKENVRALCDKIDSLIVGDAMISGPSLAILRNSVMTLMMTLKSRPEFDSVIIDKDIHNVMKWIRSTRQESLDLREIKTTKKAVKAAKKEGLGSVKMNNLKGMEAAFNKMMGLGIK